MRSMPGMLGLLVWVTIILVLGFRPGMTAQAAPEASWPEMQDWNRLTNHITQCYSGAVLRCTAAKVTLADFPPPDFLRPMNDYSRIAAKIDQLCPLFVDQRKESSGSLDGYMATNSSFPMWSVQSLHNAAGFTNWDAEATIQMFVTTNIQRQVTDTLNLLRYTACPAAPVSNECGMSSYCYGWSNACAQWWWSTNPISARWPGAIQDSATRPTHLEDCEGRRYDFNLPRGNSGWQTAGESWSTNWEGRQGWDYRVRVEMEVGVSIRDFSVSQLYPVCVHGMLNESDPQSPFYSPFLVWSPYYEDYTIVYDDPDGYHQTISNFWPSLTSEVNVPFPSGFNYLELGVMHQLNGYGDADIQASIRIKDVQYIGARVIPGRWSSVLRAQDLATNVVCGRDLYAKGEARSNIPLDHDARPIRPDFRWDPEADVGVALARDKYTRLHQAAPSANKIQDFTGFVKRSIPYPNSTHFQQGWAVAGAMWLLKWQFPGVSSVVPPGDECPDTDRDDLVDIDADVSTFGPDTGTIVFRADQDRPQVLIPLAAPADWWGDLPVRAYLAQGAIANPIRSTALAALLRQLHPQDYAGLYQPIIGSFDDDGPFQAFSLNTRILESGVVNTPEKKIKQVAMVRPRGNIVVFQFAWDSAHNRFQPDGFPIGVNSNRTYVLRDVTSLSDTDLKYDLYFDSGIVHEFRIQRTATVAGVSISSGWLSTVRHPDGRLAWLFHPESSSDNRCELSLANTYLAWPFLQFADSTWRDSQGVLSPLLDSARDAKYKARWTRQNGLITKVEYTSGTDATKKIVCDIAYTDGKITALTKSGVPGIEPSGASISADQSTITYSWGTITRTSTAPAGSPRTVTLVQSITGCGSATATTVFDGRDRITETRLSSTGTDGEARSVQAYSTASGRYGNGFPRWSKRTRIDRYPQNSWETFEYDSSTGWLVTHTAPVAGNSACGVGKTVYGYAEDALSGGFPVNTAFATELPRRVDVMINDQLVSRTLYATYGYSELDYPSWGDSYRDVFDEAWWMVGYDWGAYRYQDIVVMQQCRDATSTWNSPGNLKSTNIYSNVEFACAAGPSCQMAVPLGRILIYSSTPTSESRYSHVAGVQLQQDPYNNDYLLSDFQWTNRLASSGSHSWGETTLETNNAFGRTEYSSVTDTTSGIHLALNRSSADAFGRILISSNALTHTWTENRDWTLSGPAVVREVDGSFSSHTYCSNGWLKARNRGDTGITTVYEYDPLGQVTKETVTGSDGTIVARTARLDASGRPVSSTDLLGDTTHAYLPLSGVGTKTTTTLPNGSQIEEERFLDGQTKEVKGSGVTAWTRCKYGVEIAPDGTNMLYRQDIQVGAGGVETEWTKTYFNMLGQARFTKRSGTGSKYAQTVYDEKGRAFKQIDEEGLTHLLSYNERQEVDKSGLHINGAAEILTPASRDRFTSQSRTVAAGGITRESAIYRTDGSPTPTVLSTRSVALDGKSSASTYAGRTSTSARTDYGSGGRYTNTTTRADGGRTVAIYDKWRLKRVERYAAGQYVTPKEWEEYDYDGLGFRYKTWNSQTGQTTYLLDAMRRVKRKQFSQVGRLPEYYTYYDNTDWLKSRMDSDGKITRYDYYPNGLLKREYDGRTYDVSYEYDTQGRRIRMKTLRGGQRVETEWKHNPATGLMEEKYAGRINGAGGIRVAHQTYRDNGQPLASTDANGVVATRNYDAASGDLLNVVSTDGTSQILQSINREGRVNGVAVAGGVSNSYVHTLDGQLAGETVTGNGVVSNAALNYVYAASHPGLVRFDWSAGGGSSTVNVSYTESRSVSAVSNGNLTVSYGYAPNGRKVTGVAWTNQAMGVMQKTMDWDFAGERITNIAYRIGGTVVASYGYQYVSNSDQIARITLKDGKYWQYLYDAKDHLTFGGLFESNGLPALGLQFGYAFDDIGNTLRAGPLGADGLPMHSFVPNDLNQHPSRGWGGLVPITGTAVTNATVTVNLQPVERQGERFRALLSPGNAAGSVQTNLSVRAVRYDSAAVTDVVATVAGKLHVARAVEPVAYRPSGEITQDSRFTYTWNRRGQLMVVTSTNALPNFKLELDYYADGRRARKRYSEWNGSAWVLKRMNQFMYDGWNLVREFVTDYSQTPTRTDSHTFLWGLDLGGQVSGALGQEGGGIGGLLSITQVSGTQTNVYLPIADHQGNIQHLVNTASHTVVASYVYSPFGVLLSSFQSPASGFRSPLLFQSKYYDAETGLYYFGYRYYDPASTKWLSPDPLQEQGGLNLTAFCRNDPVNGVDPLGLDYFRATSEGAWWVVEGDGWKLPIRIGDLAPVISNNGTQGVRLCAPFGGTDGHVYSMQEMETLVSKYDSDYDHRALKEFGARDKFSRIRAFFGAQEDRRWANSRMKEFAALCEDVYSDTEQRDTGDWHRVAGKEIGVDPGLFVDTRSGFFAALYANKALNTYVLTFRGTDEMGRDMLQNVGQGMLGHSAQYASAVALAQIVARKLPRDGRLVIAGHSLGGGLASAAAVTIDRPALTFNPAGVKKSTLGSQRDAFLRHNYLITSIAVRGEILTGVQDARPGMLAFMSGGLAVWAVPRLAPDTVGQKRVLLPASRADPITLHKMPAVRAAIDRGAWQ